MSTQEKRYEYFCLICGERLEDPLDAQAHGTEQHPWEVQALFYKHFIAVSTEKGKKVSRKCMTEKEVHAKLGRISMRTREEEINLLIEDFAEKMSISSDCVDLAKKILIDAREKHLTWGHKPNTVAATALYFACRLKDNHKTMKEIADTAGIDPGTIRNNRYSFARKLNLTDSHFNPE